MKPDKAKQTIADITLCSSAAMLDSERERNDVADYGWARKNSRRKKSKLFGDDDFNFFVFISIFIFCLAGLSLLLTGIQNLIPQHSLNPSLGAYWSSKTLGTWA